jgi:hypothetical protein
MVLFSRQPSGVVAALFGVRAIAQSRIIASRVKYCALSRSSEANCRSRPLAGTLFAGRLAAKAANRRCQSLAAKALIATADSFRL